MRRVEVTQEELLERIEKIKGSDPESFELRVLVERLPHTMAKKYARIGRMEEEYERVRKSLRPPLEVVHQYMELAWSRANDCRAMSVIRSIQQLRGWLFLAGFGDVIDQHFVEASAFFGKKQLVIASLLCEFRWQDHDDGEWRDSVTHQQISPRKASEQMEAAYKIVEEALKVRDL